MKLEKIERYINLVIYHKRGKYYLVHFKELFIFDGKDSSINDNLVRRNACKIIRRMETIKDC